MFPPLTHAETEAQRVEFTFRNPHGQSGLI